MTPTIQYQYHKTKVGELIIGSYEHKICLCDWRYRKQREQVDQRIMKGLNADMQLVDNELIQETIQQIEKYLSGEIKSFDIELALIGTDFQVAVWKELQHIPFGQTISYGELAENLGDRKKVRAVASANGANATSIIVPCHRVIAQNGDLTGYAGGLSAKKKLLQLEGCAIGGQLEMF